MWFNFPPTSCIHDQRWSVRGESRATGLLQDYGQVTNRPESTQQR